MGKVSEPSLLVIEAARIFDAEAAALVGVFARHGYAWKVLSNDPAWPEPSWPTAASMIETLREFDPAFVHFALHGVEQGLVVKVSDRDASRVIISWAEIEQMDVWRGRVIVTGACGMLCHADAFLRAGAISVVAPRARINWGELCHFFRIFYTLLLGGESISGSLGNAKSYARGFYRGYRSLDVAGDQMWRLANEPERAALNSDALRDGYAAERH